MQSDRIESAGGTNTISKFMAASKSLGAFEYPICVHLIAFTFSFPSPLHTFFMNLLREKCIGILHFKVTVLSLLRPRTPDQDGGIHNKAHGFRLSTPAR